MSQQMPPELQAAITNLIGLIVRGVTLKQPAGLQIHGHGPFLFVRALMQPEAAEVEGETVELMLANCVNFTVTPATGIHLTDFSGEWPPRSLIKSLESEILIPRQEKKLIVPINGRAR